MKLQDIIAISGQPGLYKFVAQSSNGIIVEALADGKRSNVPSSSKVSSMAEIAIYTEDEDMPLSKVFQNICKITDGKQTISHKAATDQIKSHFAEALPEYDRERVHVSDMKKVFAWYNTLVESGMTDFSVDEEDDKE